MAPPFPSTPWLVAMRTHILAATSILLAAAPVLAQDGPPETPSLHESPGAGILASSAITPGYDLDVLFSNEPGHPNSFSPGSGAPFYFSNSSATFGRPNLSDNEQHMAWRARIDLGGASTTYEYLMDSTHLTQTAEPWSWDPTLSMGPTAYETIGVNDSGESLLTLLSSTATGGMSHVAKFSAVGVGLPVAIEGTPAGALLPSLPSVTWGNATGPYLSNTGIVSWEADPLGGTATGQDDVVHAGGNVLIQTGVTVPMNQAGGASATWQNIDLEDNYVRLDGALHLVQGDTDGATTEDDILALNNFVVVQEGQPLAVAPAMGNVSTIAKGWLDESGNLVRARLLLGYRR